MGLVQGRKLEKPKDSQVVAKRIDNRQSNPMGCEALETRWSKPTIIRGALYHEYTMTIRLVVIPLSSFLNAVSVSCSIFFPREPNFGFHFVIPIRFGSIVRSLNSRFYSLD